MYQRYMFDDLDSPGALQLVPGGRLRGVFSVYQLERVLLCNTSVVLRINTASPVLTSADILLVPTPEKNELEDIR